MTPRQEWAAFVLALQFLTRLPVRTESLYTPEAVARSPRWYPAAGAVIGLAAGLVTLMLTGPLPQVVAVLGGIAAAMLLTGALHEDGLADTFDGLGGSGTRERALDIMRDSRIGSYGALALGITVSTRVACLNALPVWALVPALVGGHAASRAAVTVILSRQTYARTEGAGSGVAGQTDAAGAGFACLLAAAAVIPAAATAGFAPVLGGVAVLALAAAVTAGWAARRIGGYTGDTLGAVQQLAEVGFYIGLLAWL
jgi:adenosylcobinamide-GDP ribazoletransferase